MKQHKLIMATVGWILMFGCSASLLSACSKAPVGSGAASANAGTTSSALVSSAAAISSSSAASGAFPAPTSSDIQAVRKSLSDTNAGASPAMVIKPWILVVGHKIYAPESAYGYGGADHPRVWI